MVTHIARVTPSMQEHLKLIKELDQLRATMAEDRQQLEGLRHAASQHAGSQADAHASGREVRDQLDALSKKHTKLQKEHVGVLADAARLQDEASRAREQADTSHRAGNANTSKLQVRHLRREGHPCVVCGTSASSAL